MRIGTIITAIASTVLPATAQAQQPQVDLQQVASMYVTLCIAGGRQFQSKGTVGADAKLSLRKFDVMGNVNGVYEFNTQEAAGLAQGINNALTQLAADQADKARKCLEPLREALLSYIFPGRLVGKSPETGHNPGWLVTFSGNGAGGGDSTNYGSKTVLVPPPGAIDIRPYFPRNMSGRNVDVKMTATTDQDVAESGQWGYFVKLNGSPSSYTDCTKFEVNSDGVPIINAGRHILTSQSSLDFGASGTANQSFSKHHLTITLECVFQAREFPVVTMQLKPPSGTWRPPGESEFITVSYVNPNVPPGEQ